MIYYFSEIDKPHRLLISPSNLITIKFQSWGFNHRLLQTKYPRITAVEFAPLHHYNRRVTVEARAALG